MVVLRLFGKISGTIRHFEIVLHQLVQTVQENATHWCQTSIFST